MEWIIRLGAAPPYVRQLWNSRILSGDRQTAIKIARYLHEYQRYWNKI